MQRRLFAKKSLIRHHIALLCIQLMALPASAGPILDGLVIDIFVIDPVVDCLPCSPADLDQLQHGLHFALNRLRRESVTDKGDICVAEASLIRDIALLTYEELVLTGTISHARWRDMLKAKAKISGSLSPVTRELLLQRFGDQAAGDLLSDLVSGIAGGTAPTADQELAQGLDLYGSAGYASIFRLMAEDRWDAEDWFTELGRPAASAPAGAGKAAQVSGRLNQALVTSRAEDLWMQGQLGHLLSLPDDFEVPAVTSAMASLRLSYESAIEDNYATVMRNGCGLQASAAMIEHLAADASTATGNKREDRFQDFAWVRVIHITPWLRIIVDRLTGQVLEIQIGREESNPGSETPFDELEPETETPELDPWKDPWPGPDNPWHPWGYEDTYVEPHSGDSCERRRHIVSGSTRVTCFAGIDVTVDDLD